MSKRHQMTLSDYAVMAVCPALIVLLLSSLVYFLILCVYQGAYSGRIGYIWFMFILGAVNIARLSIEESRKYTLVYSAALGLATFFVLSRFQSISGPAAAFAPFVNAFLIGIVWLLADRITYDCTLIDDDDDASGQGLLDGLSRPRNETSGGPDRPTESIGDRSGEAIADADAPVAARQATSRHRKRRPPQPGRTVLWLTAAALPLFGFGQAALRSDPAAIASASRALAVYLFATLSLLVATSFLGVRRYLRQRGVAMPTDVSTAWMGGGMLLVALILGICFLLPLPGRMLAELKLPSSLESPDWLSPSRLGWGSETAKPSAQSAGANPPPASEDASSDSDPSGPPSSQTATQPAGPSDSPTPGQSGQSGPQSESGQPVASGQSPQANTSSPSDPAKPRDSSGQPSQPTPPSRSSPSQAASPSGDSAQADTPHPSASGQPSQQGQQGQPSQQGQPAQQGQQGQPGQPDRASPSRQASQTNRPGQQDASPPTEPPTGDAESASPSQSASEPAAGQSREPQQTDPGRGDSAAERNPSGEPAEDQSSSGSPQGAPSESPEAAPSESPASPPPESSPPSLNLPSLSGLIKTLIYLILLAIVAAFLWLNRDAIADFWRRLQAWLAGNPASPAALPDEADLAAAPPTRRPFASFSNPLVAGADPRRVVIETFQAAEAWFGEHGQPRHRDETPQEYARRLKTASSGDRQAVEQVIAAYNRVVYGGERPSRQDLQHVQQLWQSVFRGS